MIAETVTQQAGTQQAINNPENWGILALKGHTDLSKHIRQTRGEEWERYIVIPPPQLLRATTSPRVAWRDARRADLPALAEIAAFFARRTHCPCNVERLFSLIGHIQTSDRHNMSDDTSRHLVMIYVNDVAGLDNNE